MWTSIYILYLEYLKWIGVGGIKIGPWTTTGLIFLKHLFDQNL